MADVFISHHMNSAGDIASQIQTALGKVGVSCWCAREDSTFPGSIVDPITEGISSCKVFLLVLNEESVRSNYTYRELYFASEETEHVQCIAFNVDGCTVPKRFRFLLSSSPTINGNPPNPEHIQQLVNQISKYLFRAMRDTIRTHEETIQRHEKTIRTHEEAIRTHEETIREQKSQIQQLTQKLKEASEQKAEPNRTPEHQREATSKPEAEPEPDPDPEAVPEEEAIPEEAKAIPNPEAIPEEAKAIPNLEAIPEPKAKPEPEAILKLIPEPEAVPEEEAQLEPEEESELQLGLTPLPEPEQQHLVEKILIGILCILLLFILACVVILFTKTCLIEFSTLEVSKKLMTESRFIFKC